jgi:hypothetical protein
VRRGTGTPLEAGGWEASKFSAKTSEKPARKPARRAGGGRARGGGCVCVCDSRMKILGVGFGGLEQTVFQKTEHMG